MNIQELTNNLEQLIKDCSFLIDCFIEIGLDPEDTQNFQDYGDVKLKILTQFPPQEVCKIKIPETLPMFCFPNGVEIIKNFKPQPSSYSNILTNEHGGLLYCSVLKIFEKIEPVDRECPQNSMRITEDSYLVLDFIKSTSEDFANTQDSERRSCRISQEFRILQSDYYVAPKGLVLVSTQPLFQTFQRLLKGLFDLSQTVLPFPLEFYISQMVTQIPFPPKGKTIIKYQIGSDMIPILLPPCNHLPVLDLNLGNLFYSLDIDNVLLLFRDILLEKSTVFISSSEEKLSICTNAVLGLLFPLHWNMVFVPILPHNLLDYLYSPVSFVFGVHSKHLEEIYSRVNESVSIVDLDNNTFLISQTQSFSRKSLKSPFLPKLPEHYFRKLKKRLLNTLSKYPFTKGKNKLQSFYIDQQTNSLIRSNFFQFFVSILLDYNKYMNFEVKPNQTTVPFNNASFIQNCSDKEFFSVFLETQMFSNFCHSRIQPKNIEEHCEGLLFDEEIIAKQNRSKLSNKKQIVFINDNSEDHSQEYIVPHIESLYDGKGIYKYKNFPVFSLDVLCLHTFPNTRPPRLAERVEKNPVNPPHWQTDEECIFTLWMDLWALFLPSQHPSEHSARIEELLTVAYKLQSCTALSTVSIYKHLLQACFDTQPSLALEIYSFMSSAKIPADAETLQLLQKSVSKLYAKDQMILMQNTGTNVVITQVEKKKTQEVKLKRVFTKPDDINVFGNDEVCFLIKELCKMCGKVLKAEDLSARWQKGSYKYETTCIHCGEILMPKMLVQIGMEIGYYKKKSNVIREETLFIAPFVLRQLVSDLKGSHKELSLEQFRCGYGMIFWNCVWYFFQKGLSYDFLLIYDEENNNSELAVSIDCGSNVNLYEFKAVQTDLDYTKIKKNEEIIRRVLEYFDRTSLPL